jgi:hypothetical protein
MRDQNLKINEDWERESIKDLVYLQEQLTELEQELKDSINKQPARIEVIDKDKVLNREHEHQNNILPF